MLLLYILLPGTAENTNPRIRTNRVILISGELISDTPPWTVDEGHDIWPDAGSIFW